jgi:hypothetical protein
VAFIQATSEMMQDLHEGANASIRVAAAANKRRLIKIPLTRDDRMSLVELQNRYALQKNIASRSGILEDDEDHTDLFAVPLSPIRKKGLKRRRFELRTTEYNRIQETVVMKQEMDFVTEKLQMLISEIWRHLSEKECPDIAVLIHNRERFSSLIDKISKFLRDVWGSGTGLSPSVASLLRALLREMKEYEDMLGRDHREFMAKLDRRA